MWIVGGGEGRWLVEPRAGRLALGSLRHGGEGDSDDGEKYEDHGDSEGCGGWWVKHIIYLQIHAVRLVHVDSGCIVGSSQVFSPIFRRSSERRGA